MEDETEAEEFQAVPGNGLSGRLNGALILGGNLSFISQRASVSQEMKQKAEKLAEEGKTPLFFARDGEMTGIIAVADIIKEDSPQAVRELQNMGIHVVMLTGDNERTARAIGKTGRCGSGHCRGASRWKGERDPVSEREREGGHGGRRHQRCAGPNKKPISASPSEQGQTLPSTRRTWFL